jgi:hypothetical protein
MSINKSHKVSTSLSLAVLASVIGTIVLVLFLSVSPTWTQPKQGMVVDNSCGICVTHQGHSFLVAPNIYIGPRNASTTSGIPPMSHEHLDKGNYIAWVAGGFASADFVIASVDDWAQSAAGTASKTARSSRNLAEENTTNEDDDDDDDGSSTNQKTSTLQQHTTFLLEERIEALKIQQLKQDTRISELEKLVMDLMSEKIQVNVAKAE